MEEVWKKTVAEEAKGEEDCERGRARPNEAEEVQGQDEFYTSHANLILIQHSWFTLSHNRLKQNDKGMHNYYHCKPLIILLIFISV